MFYGLDLKKTIAEFEDGTFKIGFQCDFCEHVTSELKINEEHYSSRHKDKVKVFHCVIEKCEYQTNGPDEMINHMINQHAEEITNSRILMLTFHVCPQAGAGIRLKSAFIAVKTQRENHKKPGQEAP